MRAAAAVMLVLLALGASAVMVRDHSQATTRAELLQEVEVTITDSGIELSRDSFVRGMIPEIHVVNESGARRNFVVGVDRSKVLAPGDEDNFVGHLPERGRIPYRVTVNCAPGLNGLLTVL
jgi:hypothetical protein